MSLPITDIEIIKGFQRCKWCLITNENRGAKEDCEKEDLLSLTWIPISWDQQLLALGRWEALTEENRPNSFQQCHWKPKKIQLKSINKFEDRKLFNCQSFSNRPACFPRIGNLSYISMERLLYLREIKINFRIPLGAWVVCSGHPWLHVWNRKRRLNTWIYKN